MDFLDRRRGSYHVCAWRGSRLQVSTFLGPRRILFFFFFFDKGAVSLDYVYCGQLNALEAFAWLSW